MVTTQAQAAANYIVPIHPNSTQAPHSAPPAPHHLNAQDIQQAGTALRQITGRANAMATCANIKYHENLASSAERARKFPNSPNSLKSLLSFKYLANQFSACVDMLSAAFLSFGTANIDLSNQSWKCLSTANEACTELEKIIPILCKALSADTTKEDADGSDVISLKLNASDIADKMVALISEICDMAIYSNAYFINFCDRNSRALKEKSHTDFDAVQATYSAIFNATHHTTHHLIEFCASLIRNIHTSFPSPEKDRDFPIEISLKALSLIGTSLRASLDFANLHHIINEIKNTQGNELQENLIIAEGQAGDACNSMKMVTNQFMNLASTAAYAHKPPENFNITVSEITDHFNSATDCISNIISTNQSLTKNIEENLSHQSIIIALNVTKRETSNLFRDLIPLQRSIQQIVSHSVARMLEAYIDPLFPRTMHGASNAYTVTSPYIDIASLTSTAARLTAASAHSFTRLNIALTDSKSGTEQERVNYKNLAHLAQEAGKAVYKTVAHYDTIRSFAFIAAKDKNAILENFQKDPLEAYKAAQAAITNFRKINFRLFESLGKSFFNEEMQNNIDSARNAGLAASEAFNAISAHLFFSPTLPGTQTRIFLQNDISSINNGEQHTDTIDQHAIYQFNRHPLIYSNIRIASRLATTITTAQDAFTSLETFKKTILRHHSSSETESSNDGTVVTKAQTLSNHANSANYHSLSIIRTIDQGALNARNISKTLGRTLQEINEIPIQFLVEYRNLIDQLASPPNEKISEDFKLTRPACAAFIESLYRICFHTNEIRISGMGTWNDFSNYEVEASRTFQALADEKTEYLLEAMFLPQNSTFNGENEEDFLG